MEPPLFMVSSLLLVDFFFKNISFQFFDRTKNTVFIKGRAKKIKLKGLKLKMYLTF